MTITSPYDDSFLWEVPACDATHVDEAVTVARRALEADPLPAWRRAEILDRAAKALTDSDVADSLARTISAETAKPVTAARGEVTRAVSTFRFSAVAARTLTGEMIPLEASEFGAGERLGFAMRVPVGVVGAITPFNFPLNLAAHKLGPAIAAGCPVVLKPGDQTPLTGIRLVELLQDRCGLPAEWLSVVTGTGPEVGQHLVDHDDVAMITFTGSVDVGWRIRSMAPRKKVALELGNNAPVIVEPDADLKVAAAKIVAAGFGFSGQACISVQRVLAHASVIDDLLGRIVTETEALVVGPPDDEQTQVSSVISVAARDRIVSWIDEAVADGAHIATGGSVDDQGVLRPTVLRDVTPDMQVCCNEVFGPVVAVASYESIDDAIAVANDTRFGLQAGVFTADLATAVRATRVLDFGGVIVNDVPTWRADQMPYGGIRDSGNTREGPLHSAREMTELRTVILNARAE